MLFYIMIFRAISLDL